MAVSPNLNKLFIHPSLFCTLHCYSLSQLSWGEGEVTPCTGHQLIAGPPLSNYLH